ncbi:hypothetical protein [Bacillus litorisediminis]|uniref:hypothetical protein n=1 Tax=Bacillus litorisediminis TaxID=2922713 RepID=UPI001FB020BB|nr:hypothetical protein [Bacillus litorisediminis]
MLTLENIKLQDDKDIIISFSYEGNQMDFIGTMKLGKEKWINYKVLKVPDFEMVRQLLARELDYIVNALEDE